MTTDYVMMMNALMLLLPLIAMMMKTVTMMMPFLVVYSRARCFVLLSP